MGHNETHFGKTTLAPGHVGDEAFCLACFRERMSPQKTKPEQKPRVRPWDEEAEARKAEARRSAVPPPPPPMPPPPMPVKEVPLVQRAPKAEPPKPKPKPVAEERESFPDVMPGMLQNDQERMGKPLAQYEMIGLALAEKVLKGSNRAESFSIEEVAELVWLRFPETFGILNGKYPCTNTVYVKMLRALARGLVVRMAANTYQVTKRLLGQVKSLQDRLKEHAV